MARGAPKSESSQNPRAREDLYEDAAMPYDPTETRSYDFSHERGAVGQPPVAAVRDWHAQALMALPGVTGVALGRTPIGDDAIVVYLRDASAKQRVPTQLEGYPVQTVVTGEIDAYGARRR